ncbi:hypothetical protein P154DRAFT_570849 [Amniculicola lignicola CBS 123094]|uniref:Uncharacterized protein n=1 Tax=Amniculicola lignicola CBS 123094 TaxID=1392246 RepID=A0A6A5WUR8_9PLEO|nr:hypothetical protein P154DRAFT_570849 [Amniculicola lignicola CBS 123094]
MLTQDDFGLANMSGEKTPLRRSSWKAEAIRRGDLKISGPFPITEETPLSEEEEKEFAEKHNSREEPPLQEQALEKEMQPLESRPAPQSTNDEEETPHSPVHGEAWEPPREQHEEVQAEGEPVAVRETTELQTRSSPEPVSHTAPSPFPSLQDSSAKTTPTKKKRQSGLRNVFRKMFGRKAKSQEREQIREESPVRRHGYHRSEPISMVQSTEPTRKENSPPRQRISELPVRELEPLNPLGQHLPFPMNVNAPQETSPQHDYLTFDTPPNFPTNRRATLPSLLLPSSSASWTGAGRLTALDERHDAESIESPQIGIALSSPPGAPTSVHSKRRSRSAGALRDLAKAMAVAGAGGAARPSVERRRSEEIRFWRNSYQSTSVYSVQTPRPRTAQTVETVLSRETTETSTRVDEEDEEVISEGNVARVPTVEQQDSGVVQSVSVVPVDQFDFGNLKNEFEEPEMPEVHQAAPDVPGRSVRRFSIEDRVKHLEDHVQDMETIVRRLSGRNNRQTIILENAPKGRRSRNRSSSATSDRQGSHHSSKSSNRTLSVKQEMDEPPSPILAPLSAVAELPPSTTVPKPVLSQDPSPAAHLPSTSLSSIFSQTSTLQDQVHALHSSLQNERSARKALELQVRSLQRDLAHLHNLVHKLLSTSPSYPTPSPDTLITSHEASTPRAVPSSQSHHTHFDSSSEIEDEEEERTPGKMRLRETVLSRFSGDSEGLGLGRVADVEVEGEGEGDGWNKTGSREDVVSPEAWTTPKEDMEERGFFGNQSLVDVHQVKRQENMF